MGCMLAVVGVYMGLVVLVVVVSLVVAVRCVEWIVEEQVAMTVEVVGTQEGWTTPLGSWVEGDQHYV